MHIFKKNIKIWKSHYGFSRASRYLIVKTDTDGHAHTFLNTPNIRKLNIRGLKFVIIGVATIFGLLTSSLALAAEKQHELNISEQSVAGALNQLAQQTGAVLIFPYDLVEARQANSLVGVYEISEALEFLLKGSGLTGSLAESGVIVIAHEKDAKASDREDNIVVGKQIKNTVLAGASALVISGVATPVMAQDSSETAQISIQNIGTASGNLDGRVTYLGTNAPLSGAIVSIEGTNLKATTNSRGEYRFPIAPAGKFAITVSYLGADAQTSTVNVVSGMKTVQNFSLSKVGYEIIVTGQRSSLMQSLNQQRSADNNSTIIAADLLGAFPAETIAEALRRVSGVAFERDANTGEGTRVSVRGFNSEAINIQLNGLDMQGTGIERSIDLTGFLTENVSQVTIHKTLLPSHESTGTGGLIEIETKSGLDYGDKFLSIGLERESNLASGFGKELQASITGAYKITDNLGVSASLQYRDTSRENYDLATNFVRPVLPFGYTSLSNVPESFDFPFDPEFTDRLVTQASYAQRQRKESNLTASFNLAYDLADHTRLRLDLQHVNADSQQISRRTKVDFQPSTRDMSVPELSGEIRRRAFLQGLRPSLGVDSNEDKLKTTSISLRGDTVIDKWEFDYKAGYSKAVNDRARNSLNFLSDQDSDIFSFVSPSTAVVTPDSSGTNRLVAGAVSFVGDNIPFLNLTSAGQAVINDPSTHYLFSGIIAASRNPSQEYTGQLSARRNFNHENLNYIEIGGKYTDARRNNSDDVLSSNSVSTQQSYVRNFSGPKTYFDDLLPGTSLGGIDLSLIGGGGIIVPALDTFIFDDIFATIASLTADDPATPENEHRFNLRDNTGDPIEISNIISPSIVTEETIAVYVQSKLNFGDFDVVGGVRYERNNRNSTTLSVPFIRDGANTVVPRDIFIDAGLIDFFNTGGTQSTLTPSVLATYRPTEQLVARAGYNRTTVHPSLLLIARPTSLFADLRPTSFFGPRVRISEANPDLSPTIVNAFDLDLAYYFKDNPGLLRAGFFFKKTTNNFTTESIVSSDEDNPEVRDRALAILQPLLATRPDLAEFPTGTAFILNRPTNGEGGIVYGFELEVIRQLDFLPSALPAFTENFSLLGNLTYATSDYPTRESARNDAGERITLLLDRPLFRQSAWTGNASLRYEDGGFSGSVIYTFQSASATGYDEFNTNNIIPKFSTLDARVSYIIENGLGNAHITLFAEGDNLLKNAKDADIRSGIGSQFGDGSAEFFFPTNVQFSGGRTFTVGAKVRF